ncbi:uncharacterized protein TNCV_763131 [Trichonephila clavipes]|nr:uncharacterized protein TNCV_763131 [Trichonephila clavipes]
MRERISCTSSRSMLTLPEKALFVKLYYQNGECASAALRSYRHTMVIRRGRLVMIVCSAATFIILGLPGHRSQSVRLLALGYLKSQMYRDRPTSLGMLKGNIRLQCLTITPDLLYSAFHNIIPRLQLLLRNDGEHIEHFL